MIDNSYALYDDDLIRLEEATVAIDDALDEAAKRYPTNPKDGFSKIIYPVLSRYEDVGATDTMSRDAVWNHFLCLI